VAKAPNNGPLNTAQLAELARTTLDNARSLLVDAHLLLDAGRWPRAYALAVLAAEEYGKFEACVVAGSYEQADEESWKQFWRDFVLHKPKLTTWAGTLVSGLPLHPAYHGPRGVD
jgi:AbiV family abortive infection protein